MSNWEPSRWLRFNLNHSGTAPLCGLLLHRAGRLLRDHPPYTGDILLLFVVIAPEDREAIFVDGPLEGLARPENGETMAENGHDGENYGGFSHY